MAELSALTDADLRALIERQFAAKRHAQEEVAELETLLTESLGEYMRRVESQEPAESKGA